MWSVEYVSFVLGAAFLKNTGSAGGWEESGMRPHGGGDGRLVICARVALRG